MILELFSCAGGMAEGFRRAGIPVDMAFDRDPDACDSYERNLGARPIQMDVRDLHRMITAGWRPAYSPLHQSHHIDLLIADPPCTPWSIAGKRRGLEDERDMLLVTCEIIELLHPVCWLIANVPGLDTSDNWQRVVQPVIGGLAQRGKWCVDYISLDAADFGVPQHRHRPFWFAHPQGTDCIRWPEPTHCSSEQAAKPTLPGIASLRPWVTCREALGHLSPDDLGRPVRIKAYHTRTGNLEISRPEKPAKGVMCKQRRGNGAIIAVPNYKRPKSSHVRSYDGPMPTITAGKGGTGNDKLEWLWPRPATTIFCDERIPPPGHHEGSFLSWPYDRPCTTVFAQTPQTGGPGKGSPGNRVSAIALSEKAAAILQGFPESWMFCGKTKKARWSQIGQAMPPPMAEAVAGAYGWWRRER